VEVVPVLSARASAMPSKIRLRAGARFSDLDVRQLIEHEAYVHVATALNGKQQRAVPILAANHAGTTRTQEGLAVFAEMISGALDPHRFLRLAHRVVAVHLPPLASSALTTSGIAVPKDRPLAEIGAPGDVPSTYVPARNTVLMSLALAWAETLGARDIFLGVNVLDASGYPDCRPEFVKASEALAQVATRGGGFKVHAPLIELTKAQIIELGRSLGVDYGITHSCYDPVGDRACGRCDACVLRKKGFDEAGGGDPTRY
jgi:7-cyano-7-deazaguanine synthase